jgi:alkylhydroperoxidase family enzyme
LAREAGLTEELVADIADHAGSVVLPERTKAALAWADVVLGGGHDAPPQVIADLQRLFIPDEIVEITYAIGTFIGYSKQIITLGMEPEHLPLVVVPTPR